MRLNRLGSVSAAVFSFILAAGVLQSLPGTTGFSQPVRPATESREADWLPWAVAAGGLGLMVIGGVVTPYLWKRWRLKRWQQTAHRHLQSGELDKAQTVLEVAVTQNPDQGMLHMLLGDTLMQQHDYTGAFGHYQSARVLEPDNAHLQLLVASALQARGQQALGKGKLSEAIRDFQEALATLPKRGAATGLAHFGIAWVLMHYDDRGHWMQAIASLEAVSAAAPALAEASCAQAILHSRHGRYEEAVTECWQALERNDGLAIAHHIMGQSLYRSGQARAAISAYRIAFSMSAADDPFIPYLRVDLALALIQSGDLPLAEVELSKVLSVAPDLMRVQWAYGLLLDAKGDYKAAAQRYEMALRLNNNCLIAAAGLALNYLTQKKLGADGGKRMIHIREVEASLRKFEQIVSKDAQVAEAHFGLGEISRIRGGWVYAAQHYQAALNANGSYTEAHYRLGIVLARMGNQQEAIASLRRCLDLKPNHQEARTNLNRLLGQQMVGSMTELVS